MVKLKQLFRRVVDKGVPARPRSHGSSPSAYYDLERTRRHVVSGQHRALAGGFWDEIGNLARDFVIAQGLTPSMTFLDIGCGCFRVGVHLVDYLDAGHYFGIDLSEELLSAGYEQELRPLGLDLKLPRRNLLCDDEFNFTRFENAPRFDMALALSLFTHLPLNHLRLCMEKLQPAMAPGAKVIATIFHCVEEGEWSQPMVHEPGGITTFAARDPYHYRSSDLERCIEGLRWKMSEPQEWNHPRGQAVVVFVREA